MMISVVGTGAGATVGTVVIMGVGLSCRVTAKLRNSSLVDSDARLKSSSSYWMYWTDDVLLAFALVISPLFSRFPMRPYQPYSPTKNLNTENEDSYMIFSCSQIAL